MGDRDFGLRYIKLFFLRLFRKRKKRENYNPEKWKPPFEMNNTMHLGETRKPVNNSKKKER